MLETHCRTFMVAQPGYFPGISRASLYLFPDSIGTMAVQVRSHTQPIADKAGSPAATRRASSAVRTSPVRFLAHTSPARASPPRAVRFAAQVATVEPAPVLAMAVHTPPAHRVVPGTPPQVDEPAAGCSLEALRAWPIQQFKVVKADATVAAIGGDVQWWIWPPVSTVP